VDLNFFFPIGGASPPRVFHNPCFNQGVPIFEIFFPKKGSPFLGGTPKAFLEIHAVFLLAAAS